jgi:3'-phosphoadenosine 5'-phosphosulfate sulfotransferase (PAPS reductase)/FAD synthetase
MSAEEIVDKMLARGQSIMSEVIAKYKPIAIVAMFSGGDDSIVATHFTVSNFSQTVVFNADTKTGLAPARKHIASVATSQKWNLIIGEAMAEGPPERMRSNGRLVPFDSAKACPAGVWTEGATAYEEFVLNWGFPGRGKPQHARMYQRLKERPMRRFFKTLGVKKGSPVVCVSGIRHDESAIRAGYKREYAEGLFNDIWVNPFYYNTAADFELYRQEFGLPRNPVKRLCGISGECCCGTFAADGEIDAYNVADPEFVKYLRWLEARVKSNGMPWGWGQSPPKWWVNERADKKCGQAYLFDGDGLPTFQPMCVGCNNGRR